MLLSMLAADGRCMYTGYRVHRDKLDGYAFQYPQSWAPVSVSCSQHFMLLKAICQHVSLTQQAHLADLGQRHLLSKSL